MKKFAMFAAVALMMPMTTTAQQNNCAPREIVGEALVEGDPA